MGEKTLTSDAFLRLPAATAKKHVLALTARQITETLQPVRGRFHGAFDIEHMCEEPCRSVRWVWLSGQVD
jgi:hypothetical protein